jgi:hypothetical protein
VTVERIGGNLHRVYDLNNMHYAKLCGGLLIIPLLFLFLACDPDVGLVVPEPEPEPEPCILSIWTSGEGTVTVSPQKSAYFVGDKITLSATPEEGWGFYCWDDDSDNTGNPSTLIFENDIDITAVFLRVCSINTWIGAYVVNSALIAGLSVQLGFAVVDDATGAYAATSIFPHTGWWVGFNDGHIETDGETTLTDILEGSYQCFAWLELNDNGVCDTDEPQLSVPFAFPHPDFPGEAEFYWDVYIDYTEAL